MTGLIAKLELRAQTGIASTTAVIGNIAMNTNLNINREAIDSAIAEGCSVIESLLSGNAVPFRGMTGNTLPEKSGIYAIIHQRTGTFLYAGKTNKGLKSRIWVGHRTVGGGSDLAQILADKKVVKTRLEGRKWMEDHCAVLYLTENEIGMDIRIAEHFIISILRPKLNKE